MIASICDRCGAVVEASGDDAPLAFYAQVEGEDAVVMDDLCPKCMAELRSVLDAFASNAFHEVTAENVTVPDAGQESGPSECPDAAEAQGQAPDKGQARPDAHVLAASERNPYPEREMPRRIGTHSFSIPKTGKYTRSSDQS